MLIEFHDLSSRSWWVEADLVASIGPYMHASGFDVIGSRIRFRDCDLDIVVREQPHDVAERVNASYQALTIVTDQNT